MAAIEADVSAGVNRLTHVPARVQCQLVIVGAANQVAFIRGVDRDRRFVAGPIFLAAGIGVRGRLEPRRADSVAGMESRTAAEDGAGNGCRGVSDVVGEVDRLAVLANDGRQAHRQCKRGTAHQQCSHGTLRLTSDESVLRHHGSAHLSALMRPHMLYPRTPAFKRFLVGCRFKTLVGAPVTTHLTPPWASDTAHNSAPASDTHRHSHVLSSHQRSDPACARPAPHACDDRYSSPWRKSGCIRRAMHPRWLRCSSLKYSRYSRSSRLARGALRPSRCDARLSPRAASTLFMSGSPPASENINRM